jgi:hypothetical protein
MLTRLYLERQLANRMQKVNRELKGQAVADPVAPKDQRLLIDAGDPWRA